ncbi:MAG: galactose-1-phosphate uridylyltransferase [Mycobacterium sp.]|nr:galactose-1-phosphate uridylyltransferase [Mycobacterium sp.]
MKRTSIALADGRELIYFDADDGADRGQLDQRTLDPVPHRSQLRYDVMLGQWVMIAAHRQRRTFQPSPAECPLCPTRAAAPTEIPASDYDVVVFENRFPALAMTKGTAGPISETATLPGRLNAADGIGRCEVVCFTSDHDASFAELTPEAADLVVEAWIDRTTELSALPGIEQVFCFENRGKEIGVTIDHPHGQIYAYPFLTPRTANVLRNAEAYRARTGRSLVDDMLASEQAAGVRVVARTDQWTAFVPFAARWPYELHLYPNRRVPDLASLSPEARAEFAPLYLNLLRRFDRLFDERIPYIAAVHQAPVRRGRDELGMHVELFTLRRAADRLKYLAGSESAMDAYANDVSPEDAARRLARA